MAKIRFIVETISRKLDRNGNRYHFARITSTATGESLVMKGIGGPSNARADVVEAIRPTLPKREDWYGAVYAVELELSPREWDRVNKHTTGRYPHQISAADILALETGAKGYSCKSVAGGWQTLRARDNALIGPVFNDVQDLWNWQKEHREALYLSE